MKFKKFLTKLIICSNLLAGCDDSKPLPLSLNHFVDNLAQNEIQSIIKQREFMKNESFLLPSSTSIELTKFQNSKFANFNELYHNIIAHLSSENYSTAVFDDGFAIVLYQNIVIHSLGVGKSEAISFSYVIVVNSDPIFTGTEEKNFKFLREDNHIAEFADYCGSRQLNDDYVVMLHYYERLYDSSSNAWVLLGTDSSRKLRFDPKKDLTKRNVKLF